uniref:EBV BKRF2 homologue n=1 Tax=Leporid herpesvirus 1 TaxID=46017 RepID=Q69274_9GAMA|nr:EBV BKRF2 homologue [Leporid herpesvirus 1]
MFYIRQYNCLNCICTMGYIWILFLFLPIVYIVTNQESVSNITDVDYIIVPSDVNSRDYNVSVHIKFGNQTYNVDGLNLLSFLYALLWNLSNATEAENTLMQICNQVKRSYIASYDSTHNISVTV